MKIIFPELTTNQIARTAASHFEDIEFLLKEGRRVNYEETYNLLKQVQDMG